MPVLPAAAQPGRSALRPALGSEQPWGWLRLARAARAHSVDGESQALPSARLPPPPRLGERATGELEPSHFLPICDCVAWTSEASAERTNQAKPMIITALFMAQFRIKKVDRGRKCAKSCRFRSNLSFMSPTTSSIFSSRKKSLRHSYSLDVATALQEGFHFRHRQHLPLLVKTLCK